MSWEPRIHGQQLIEQNLQPYCSLSPIQPIANMAFFFPFPYLLNSSLYPYLTGTSFCSHSVSTMTTILIIQHCQHLYGPSVLLLQALLWVWFASHLIQCSTQGFLVLCILGLKPSLRVNNLPQTTRYHALPPIFSFLSSPRSSLSPLKLTAVFPTLICLKTSCSLP